MISSEYPHTISVQHEFETVCVMFLLHMARLIILSLICISVHDR